MNKAPYARYEARANLIKALAHPTRLAILDRLADGECQVAGLTALIGTDQSTVSRHLSQLKGCGFIREEKRSNRVFCTLGGPHILAVLRTLDGLGRKIASEAFRSAPPAGLAGAEPSSQSRAK